MRLGLPLPPLPWLMLMSPTAPRCLVPGPFISPPPFAADSGDRSSPVLPSLPPRRRCMPSALRRRRRQSPRLLDVQGYGVAAPTGPCSSGGGKGVEEGGWPLRSGGFAVLSDKCGHVVPESIVLGDGLRANEVSSFGLSNSPGAVAEEHPSRTLFVRNNYGNIEDSELRSLFENKPLRRRKLDIHFSIPKENPSDKDLNQGTLVIFNLDQFLMKKFARFLELMGK